MVVAGAKREWHAFPGTISTGLQLKSYLDSCTEWLCTIPQETGEAEAQVLPGCAVPSRRDANTLGVLMRDALLVRSALCALCNTSMADDAGSITSANPFTRAQYMVVCHTCADSLVN